MSRCDKSIRGNWSGWAERSRRDCDGGMEGR